MPSRFFEGAGERPRRPHLVRGKEVGDLRDDAEDGFQRVQDEHDAVGIQLGSAVKFTPEGGLAIRLTNDTGAASVKGSLIEASHAVEQAVSLTDASGDDDCMGVIHEDGVADGDPVWVVVAGMADVLLEDGTSATRGYWAGTAATAGRADITNLDPPGLVDAHFTEIGHCVQSATAGTNVLARCVLHFN